MKREQKGNFDKRKCAHYIFINILIFLQFKCQLFSFTRMNKKRFLCKQTPPFSEYSHNS